MTDLISCFFSQLLTGTLPSYPLVHLMLLLVQKDSSGQSISRQNHKQSGLWEERKWFGRSSYFFLFDDWNEYSRGQLKEQLHSFYSFCLLAYFVQQRKKKNSMLQNSICCYISQRLNALKNRLIILCAHFLYLWTDTSHKTPSCIDNLLK